MYDSEEVSYLYNDFPADMWSYDWLDIYVESWMFEPDSWLYSSNTYQMVQFGSSMFHTLTLDIQIVLYSSYDTDLVN